MRREDWRAKSNCRDLPPQKFFPDAGRLANDATNPCTTCPVRTECLDFALSSPWEPYGVWGGLQSKDLKPMWRNRNSQDRFEATPAFTIEKGRSIP